MARSSKKGPFVDLSLEKKIAKAKETNDRKPIKFNATVSAGSATNFFEKR